MFTFYFVYHITPNGICEDIPFQTFENNTYHIKVEVYLSSCKTMQFQSGLDVNHAGIFKHFIRTFEMNLSSEQCRIY